MYFINERMSRRIKIQTVNTIYHHSSEWQCQRIAKAFETHTARFEKWIFVLIHAHACRIHRLFYTNGNFNAANSIVVGVVVCIAVVHLTFVVGVFDQFYTLVYPRSMEYLFIVAIIAIQTNHHPQVSAWLCRWNAFSWFSRINRFT